MCVMWSLCMSLWCGCVWILVTTLLWLCLCLVIRGAMGKEHQENKRAIRNSHQKVSEHSAVSMRNLILVYGTFLKWHLHEFKIIFSSRLQVTVACIICIQGPDVLSEPSEGGRRRELKAAASTQGVEWGVPCEACMLFTGLSCEFAALTQA